jgi:hypothetical protein
VLHTLNPTATAGAKSEWMLGFVAVPSLKKMGILVPLWIRYGFSVPQGFTHVLKSNPHCEVVRGWKESNYGV